MTTYATNSFDSHPHHTLYTNRTYACTTTTTTTTTRSSAINQPSQSYLKSFTPINICENRLYDITIAGDVGSATSSSYINSSEHYDNTYINTYDNPIQYLDNYNTKSIDIIHRSLNDVPNSNENFYDHAKDNNEDCSANTSRSSSPVLFYLENKNLAICACIISLLLLLLIGLGIFLLNKLIRPVIINTTVNNHYGLLNMSNTTATMISTRSTVSTPLFMLLKRASATIPQSTMMAKTLTTTITTSAVAAAAMTTTSTSSKNNFIFSCPPDRWGDSCENICKPCGLGRCHSITGQCICPMDIYGEFCDLWTVNDKPKRGDMTR